MFVLFSGILKRLATKVSNISNDLRVLSSGPHSLAEINLPASARLISNVRQGQPSYSRSS
ncbi:hypothetical protein H8B02_20770 [Bradyrhizobium sp. Pear77]|nr:hypothetical protein [Bradyrhizobium altum]